MIKLAAGEFDSEPFSDTFYEGIRGMIAKEFGLERDDWHVAERQCFRLRMISKVLKAFGDPDWQFAREIEDGVALGVSEELPRAEGIFEEKFKWKLEDDGSVPETDRENYLSVEPFQGEGGRAL